MNISFLGACMNQVVGSQGGGSWDLDTMIYNGEVYDFSSFGLYLFAFRFNNDGTKAYALILDGSPVNSGIIYQFDLSSPYVISSMVYNGVNLDFSSEHATSFDFRFNPNGSSLYILGRDPDNPYGSNYSAIFQYDLSIPFDLSSYSYYGQGDLNRNYRVQSGAMSMWFGKDSILYGNLGYYVRIFSYQPDIREVSYELLRYFNVTDLNLIAGRVDKTFNAYVDSLRDVWINEEINKGFIADSVKIGITRANLYEYQGFTSTYDQFYDLSTIMPSTAPMSLEFINDGKNLYVTGRDGKLHKFTL